MKNLFNRIEYWLWQPKRGLMYRDMADAIRRRQSITSFFEIETASAKMLKDDSKLKVMRLLGARYKSGAYPSFQELFAPVVPQSDLLLLSAVDAATADQAEAFEAVADAVDFKVRSTLAILKETVLPLASIPLVGYLCYVTAEGIAIISKTASASIWVGFNGMVKWTTDTMLAWWPAILLGIFGLIVATFLVLPRWKTPLRLKIEGWPLFNLYRDYNAANVLSSMAMMMRSGAQLEDSLKQLMARSSGWLRWHLSRILTSLKNNPGDYNSAFSKGLMSPTVRARIASLQSSSSSFGDVLKTLGSTEIKRMETSVQKSAQFVGYLLMGLLLSLALFLSIGLMTISNAVSKDNDPANQMKRRMQSRAQAYIDNQTKSVPSFLSASRQSPTIFKQQV